MPATRKGKQQPAPRAKRVVDPLVVRLCGEIASRAQQAGLDYKELSRRAGPYKGTSTWDGWRNGSTRSPSLLDLERFANVVKLSVGLIEQSAAQDNREAENVSMLDEVIGKLQKLDPERRGYLLRTLEEKIDAELAKDPHALDADQPGHRGQGNK